MRLPPDVRERLAREYRFVAGKIRDEQLPLRKVYFFSALFTEISRNLNWHWDSDLVLLHWVLQATHTALNSKLQSPTPWVNAASDDTLVNRLGPIADNLASYMEQGAKGREFHGLIAQIAELGYLATNHGGYVMEKGLVPTAIELPSPQSRDAAPR